MQFMQFGNAVLEPLRSRFPETRRVKEVDL
jgi:hypothetical protein